MVFCEIEISSRTLPSESATIHHGSFFQVLLRLKKSIEIYLLASAFWKLERNDTIASPVQKATKSAEKR